MKRQAIAACAILAGWIFDGASFAWILADRIERRWRIQGTTSATLRTMEERRAAYLKAQRTKHDRQHPDRLTYLHR